MRATLEKQHALTRILILMTITKMIPRSYYGTYPHTNFTAFQLISERPLRIFQDPET